MYGAKSKPEEEEWYTMSQAVKIIDLSMGRNNLFAFLREHKVLMRNNEPYQKYIDSVHFKYRIKDIGNGYGSVIGRKPVTLVSIKGIEFIKNLIKKNQKNEREK